MLMLWEGGQMSDPVVAQKAPYGVKLVAGKSYAWCACGLSANQPFCDGKHKSGDIRPIVFKAEADEEVWLCGCKQTKNGPHCDGTHNGL
jgi:CDGSH-type Zn-finger protein